ncbi:MAG: hypothetical protein ACTHZ9_12850 [Leucobacter sp.]
MRVKAWSKSGAKERILNALKEDLTINGNELSAERVMAAVHWIKRRRGSVLQGYASYIEKILRVIEEHEVKFGPCAVGAVVSGAEAPSSYFWEASQRVFGVSPHARYSNMEHGLISTTSQHDRDLYKVDTSTFHVEILEEERDVAVAPGELGRIVVTDLHNRVMPLLRYDTGDLGRFAVSHDGRAVENALTDIRGRRLDVLIAGRRDAPVLMHPLVAVWGEGANLSEVRQFQLRQHEIGRFTWVLNANRSSSLEHRFRRILEERVGDIVECGFEYVDEVEVLGSGKRQYFVSDIDDPQSYVAEFNGSTGQAGEEGEE